MSLNLLVILSYLSEIAKENQTGPVVCCWCNNCVNFIRYGFYSRYSFSENEQIKIQRYLCKHDQCRRTFSMLPHPFLRITRLPLCVFKALLKTYGQQPVAGLARQVGLSRQSISRALSKGRSILSWLREEAQTDPPWAPSPCLSPSRHWSDFIRMFAAKFYPSRYGAAPPTEYGNCL